jgi:mRNA interferase RelE/StbE
VPWVYRVDERALKEIKKLDHHTQREIFAYFDTRIAGPSDPRRFGKGLTGNFRGLWRYRIGDYRIVCQIKDRELIVLILSAGHRREIYR